jgi:hypothetical protein
MYSYFDYESLSSSFAVIQVVAKYLMVNHISMSTYIVGGRVDCSISFPHLRQAAVGKETYLTVYLLLK